MRGNIYNEVQSSSCIEKKEAKCSRFGAQVASSPELQLTDDLSCRLNVGKLIFQAS